MLVGTAITGTPTSPPTTLGNAPSIPAQTITTRARVSASRFASKPMNPRHAHIVEVLDFIPHHFRCDDRLFRDRNIAGPGRDHRHNSLAVFRRIFLQDNGAGEFAKFHTAYFFLYGGKLLFAGASRQDVPAMLRQPFKDSGSLRRSFPFSENDFRHPVPQRAMMINFRKPQVFEGQVTQTHDCIVGRDRAFAHFLKQFADGFSVQEDSAVRARHSVASSSLASTRRRCD